MLSQSLDGCSTLLLTILLLQPLDKHNTQWYKTPPPRLGPYTHNPVPMAKADLARTKLYTLNPEPYSNHFRVMLSSPVTKAQKV